MFQCGARALIVSLMVILGAAETTACETNETTIEVGCDLTGPLIKLIALTLKMHPTTSLGSLALDAASIPVSAACKRWMGSKTEPTTAEEFLSHTEELAPIFRLPVGVGVCGSGSSEFASVAAVFGTTSCPFSLNVQSAFLLSSRDTPLTVQAWSPVTNHTYTMTCTGQYPVVCRGGDNAGIYIY
ncbi:hypothetical protein NONI108955_43885 [Nocardia ninae]|uniref:Uncharacterized protein n=3 Tax=Nocardia ninae TaxID=356145 RepID=A0A511MJU0_9NOCA|nr:hypothetical protein NN4_49270 [Nocardia ninae NBRC 108245]